MLPGGRHAYGVSRTKYGTDPVGHVREVVARPHAGATEPEGSGSAGLLRVCTEQGHWRLQHLSPRLHILLCEFVARVGRQTLSGTRSGSGIDLNCQAATTACRLLMGPQMLSLTQSSTCKPNSTTRLAGRPKKAAAVCAFRARKAKSRERHRDMMGRLPGTIVSRQRKKLQNSTRTHHRDCREDFSGWRASSRAA